MDITYTCTVMMTALAFLFLVAAFVCLYEKMKWTAAFMAATSFSVAASVSLATQLGGGFVS